MRALWNFIDSVYGIAGQRQRKWQGDEFYFTGPNGSLRFGGWLGGCDGVAREGAEGDGNAAFEVHAWQYKQLAQGSD